MKASKKHLLTIALLVAGGTALGLSVMVRQERTDLAHLQKEVGRQKIENQDLRRERNEVLRRISNREQASAADTPANPTQPSPSLVAPPAADSLDFRWLSRARQAREAVARLPEKNIPELGLLSEQDWLIAAQKLNFDSDEAARRSLSTLRIQAKEKLAPRLIDALADYAAAHQDRLPSDPVELAPYLQPAVPEGTLQRYEMLRKGLLADVPIDAQMRNEEAWLIGEKSRVDEQYDSRLTVSPMGFTVADGPFMGRLNSRPMKHLRSP